MSRKPIISIATIFAYFEEKRTIQKGENAFNSGNVQKVQFIEELSTVKGEVFASMKKQLYKVELILTKDGILESMCTCPRGLYLCHHMAAVALFVHYNISTTSIACSWVKTAKDSDNKKVTDLFPKPSASLSYSAVDEDISEERIQTFYQDLKKCGRTGMGWLLAPTPKEDSEDVVVNIESIIFCDEYTKTTNKTKYLQEKLALKEEDILSIANLTVGQHDNPLWLIARKHRLTASNFGRVIKAVDKNRFPPSLFKTLTGSYNLDGVKQIQWGRQNEINAVRQFEEQFNIKVVPTGIWFTKEGVVGASPDGLIGENGIIEIKCPFKYKNCYFKNVLSNNNTYILKYLDNHFIVNQKHDYYDQIQGQLYILNREMCYLCVWSTVDFITVKIEKDIDWKNNISKLLKFYYNHYVKYVTE